MHEGSLNIAVLYNPLQRPDLVSELLVEERRVMVTTAPDAAMNPAEYVYVDWGPSFAANYQAAFPELGSPSVSISLGPMALTYLLSVGGSGYFRIGTAQSFLADGRLKLVKDAPEFSWSAYRVCQTAGRACHRPRAAWPARGLPGGQRITARSGGGRASPGPRQTQPASGGGSGRLTT
ncbi:unnamed protein product [Candidatus Paraburkholderia kirkii UZHbot1]|uniref:WGS project CAFE00000000 data, contig bkir_c194 n=1 Tax=Candidatus Paraburkholderia kirkii UZHbot1 TaxID=1055526 RepID=U3UAS7_9BURK|nr:unnamed protein product [Candidatus Paraburkholderia kirkii UZHbot1]